MKKTAAFYRMFRAGDFGVAFSPPEIDSVELIPDRGAITSWTPLELVVKPGEWEGPPSDYVHNDLDVRLCSKRLKDLLDSLRSDADEVQWLPAYVTDLAGNRVKHFVLHFPEPPDVLDIDNTIFANESDVLVRPTLSISKIGRRRLFNFPGLYSATIVHDSIKDAIESAGMQGIEFSPIRTRD